MASFPTDTTTSNTLDRAAAHDPSLYDPNVHDNRIVAMYETDERARAARDKLVAEGVPAERVEIMDRSQDRYAGGVDYESNTGLWGAIKGLFVPDEDAHGYAEGVNRGHAMLVVNPEGMANRERIIEVLESTDPIDFDAKLEEWRQAGYAYPGEQAGGTVRDQGASLATGASAYSHSPHLADTDATPAGLAAGGLASSAAMEAASPSGKTSTPPTSTTASTAAHATGTTAASAAMPTGAAARTADAGDTIKVVEERMRVGKREVARGGVRVRSYVVERPVEEQVHLHEERVTVERRPVNRPAEAGDAGAFQDRTIEVTARSEEAVVSKEARVVEEIGIRKEAGERVETVRDSVRKTEVEVEDDTAARTASRTTGVTGATTAKTTTPGTGAGSPTRRN